MGLLIALSIILTRVASLRIAIGGVEGIRIGLGRSGWGNFRFSRLFYQSYGGLYASLYPNFCLNRYNSCSYFKLSQENELNVLELSIAIAAGQIITSLVLVPYFLHTLFGLPWKILMPPRIIGAPISIFIYAYTINMILKRKCLIYSNNEV
jgi:hypothetical protein